MKNKKTKLILLNIIFLMVLFGNIDMVNAEVLTNTKSYHEPYSGMSVDFNVVAGDYVYWLFKTYDHEFLVDIVLIDELGNEQSYGTRIRGCGSISFQSTGSYTLEFMNYDIYSGYMELFVGLNEQEEEESVVITSVVCGRSIIDVEWEVAGSVWFINLDLYYGDEFITKIFDEVQCSSYDSIRWGFYDNEDVFSGDEFRIKITDFDDPDVYSFSDYFTIEVDDPYKPYDMWKPTGNVLFFVIISIAIVGVIIIGYIIFKKKASKEPTIQIKEVPKNIYCSECGIKITDMTKDYCSQCGSKIII